MSSMKLSSSGFAHIKKYEGFSSKLYNDGGKNKGHCTIGYGHLVHKGTCNAQKHSYNKSYLSGITKKQGSVLLRQDVLVAERAVNRLVKVPLTQNQFDALVSFSYNVGSGNLSASTLLKLLNKKDYAKAAEEFKKWKYSNGKILPGLPIRRKSEKSLFIKK